MVQPPPLVEENKLTPDTRLSLDDTIHRLCDIIFHVALPKTKPMKTVTVPIETLHLAHDLVGSMCALLWECHAGSQLHDISKQLADIKT